MATTSVWQPSLNATIDPNITTTLWDAAITTEFTNSTNSTSLPTKIYVPSWLEWMRPVIEFYSDRTNLAYYLVGPLMALVYGGSIIIYIIGQLIAFTGFKLKVRRAKKLGLPPPKKKKKPNIFQRAKARYVKNEEKKEKEKVERKEKREAEVKKKIEEAIKIEAAKPKMMTAEERRAYLKKYHPSFQRPDPSSFFMESSNSSGGFRDKFRNAANQLVGRNQSEKPGGGWSGSFAKAYAQAFLSIASPTPSEEAQEETDDKPAPELDLWTMAQLARLETKRTQLKSRGSGTDSKVSGRESKTSSERELKTSGGRESKNHFRDAKQSRGKRSSTSNSRSHSGRSSKIQLDDINTSYPDCSEI